MKKNKFVILLILILIPLAISFCLSYWVIKNEEIFWPNYVKIEKIEPTISWPTMSELDNTILEGDKITLSNNGSATYVDENGETQSIDGVFSIEDTTKLEYEDGAPVSDDLEKSVSFSIKTTFTPNETDKYSIVQKSNTIYMLPVARIGSNYYGTIKKALDYGGSDSNSNTIYVIVGSEKGGRSPYIRSNTTIYSKDKLIIPYNDTGNYENRNGVNGFFADSDETKIETYRKNNVTVIDNVNITISKDAELIVGGTLGSETQGLQGHTSGNYCQITLGSSSKILNNGTLNVFGYIKESTKDNKSYVENFNESSVYVPFVIYDYRGGQNTAGAFENNQKISIFPFNVYDFPNIQSQFIANYGTSVYGYVDMFTGQISKSIFFVTCTILARHNLSVLNLVSTSGALINLGNGAKLSLKYTPTYIDNLPLTVADKSNGITTLTFIGTVQFGDLTLSIRAADSVIYEPEASKFLAQSTVESLLNRDLSTSTVYFPVSWKYNIILNNSDFTVNNKLKLLPGSSLTVDSSSSLVISSNSKMVVYESFVDGYGTESLKYPVKDSAIIINNGKLTVDGAIGATILTNVSNAILELNTSDLSINDSYEGYASMNELSFDFTETNKDESSNTKTITTKGFYENSTIYQDLNMAFYTSTNRTETDKKNYGYWSDSGDYEILTIEFVASGANETINSKKVIAIPNTSGTAYVYLINEENLPKPTKNHYDFSGWFTEETFTNSADGLEINSNIILYAKFDVINYTINYQIEYDECTQSNLINNNVKLFNINSTVSLSQPSDGNLKFDGWYIDDAYTTKITQLSVDDITSGREITVYGKFTNKKQYNVSFVAKGIPDSDIANYIFDSKNIYEDVKVATILPSTDTKDDDITEDYKYYFADWFVDSDLTQTVDRSKLIKDYANESDLNVIFYSKWQSKYTLTIKPPENGDGNKDATVDVYIDSNYVTTYKKSILVYYLLPGRIYKLANDVECKTIISSLGSFETSKDYEINENVTITITANTGTCVAAGTLIIMADGTYKKVEDVKTGDQVLVFNHFTGQFDTSIVMYNAHDKQSWTDVDIINLVFDNGQTVKMVTEHAFFNLTLNEYSIFTFENVESFIGHEFFVLQDLYSINKSSAKLIDVYYTTEFTGVYSPVTANGLNCFTDGFLSIAGDFKGFYNIFEFDENQKYDEELMKQDIEKYGLYTHEDFKDYVPEVLFDAYQGQYLKVSIGKGHTTFEEILQLIEKYINDEKLPDDFVNMFPQ